jgi:DNA-directed RNA polymerase subunit alpha
MIREIIFPENVKIISLEEKIGVFEIFPLYPGYGHTIGNSLRRVLLSSIKGAAITTVKINDVLHEFSTITGVLEDVIDIVLSLKHVRVKYNGDEPIELDLYKRGEGEVLAKDIKCPAGVEIVNPNHKIATITKKDVELKMKLIVERGYGYVNSEENKISRVEPGVIVLDAIFSPIVNASYEVENFIYQKRTDYNLLRLSIETDGTINPLDALKEALNILINYYQKINEAFSKS